MSKFNIPNFSKSTI